MPFHQLTIIALFSVEAGTRHISRNQSAHHIGTVETLLGPRFLVKPNSQREPALRHVVKTCCNIISNNWPYDYCLQKSCWATQWHKLEMRLSIRCFYRKRRLGATKGFVLQGFLACASAWWSEPEVEPIDKAPRVRAPETERNDWFPTSHTRSNLFFLRMTLWSAPCTSHIRNNALQVVTNVNSWLMRQIPSKERPWRKYFFNWVVPRQAAIQHNRW